MSDQALDELLIRPEIPIKQRLIAAGIGEIESHGVRDFSLRRTAAACGVSCAAPYKHFRSKDELITAILDRYRDEWNGIQRSILELHRDDYRSQLTEMSIEYVRFLVSNPAYRTIIMAGATDEAGDPLFDKPGVTDISLERVELYCEEQNMPPKTKKAKLFIVRSLIYGAALMISNRELADCEDTYEMVRHAISREFDIKL